MYMYKTIKSPYKYYVYDGNMNSILEIEKSEFESLRRIEEGRGQAGDNVILQSFQKSGFCNESNIKEIKHPDTDNVEYYLESMLSRIYLQVTQNCNLRCNYCVYSGNYKNRTHSDKVMDFEMAKKAVDYLVKHSYDSFEYTVGFYGGEPLLEFELIKKVISYIKSNYSNKKFVYTITTNGTLLSSEITNYLVKNDFRLVISLDGHKECQDTNRKFISGKGTFDIIIKNLERIRDQHPDYFSTILINSVLSPDADIINVKDFFATHNLIKNMRVISTAVSEVYSNEMIYYPDEYRAVERFETSKCMLWLIGKLDFDKVSDLFTRWNGPAIEKYRLMKKIGKISEVSHPGGPCIPGKFRLFIDINGNIFPCERISEKSQIMNIGNLNTGIDVQKVKDILNVGSCTKEECRNCWCFIFCGQCAAHADELDNKPSPEKRLSRCNQHKEAVIDDFLDICFLKENSYNFEEGVLQWEKL